MPAALFVHPQNAPKSFMARVLPKTPLWELTVLPQKSATVLREKRKMEGDGKEDKRREEKDASIHGLGYDLTLKFNKQ